MATNKIFRGFAIFFLAITLMFFQVNALTIQQGQNDNLFDYNKALKGNYLSDFYNADNNEVQNLEGGGNLTYDYRLSLSQVTQPFYIIIDNLEVNSTYTISYSNNLAQSQDINTFNTTLLEEGKYYYKFTPSTNGEESIIYIDNLQDGNGTSSPDTFFIGYQEEKPQGFSYIIQNFVDFFVEVLEINLNIWKLLFYTIIFVLSTALVLFIFSLAFIIFGYARDMKKKEKPKRTIPESD